MKSNIESNWIPLSFHHTQQITLNPYEIPVKSTFLMFRPRQRSDSCSLEPAAPVAECGRGRGGDHGKILEKSPSKTWKDGNLPQKDADCFNVFFSVSRMVTW